MSESAILEVVKKNFEDHLILGEEGGIIGDTSSDYLWCIDPLGVSLAMLICLFFLEWQLHMVLKKSSANWNCNFNLLAYIEEKMKELVKMVGYVLWSLIDASMRKSNLIQVDGVIISKERPKIIWVEVIKKEYVEEGGYREYDFR